MAVEIGRVREAGSSARAYTPAPLILPSSEQLGLLFDEVWQAAVDEAEQAARFELH
jgi:hypothetical protein